MASTTHPFHPHSCFRRSRRCSASAPACRCGRRLSPRRSPPVAEGSPLCRWGTETGTRV